MRNQKQLSKVAERVIAFFITTSLQARHARESSGYTFRQYWYEMKKYTALGAHKKRARKEEVLDTLVHFLIVVATIYWKNSMSVLTRKRKLKWRANKNGSHTLLIDSRDVNYPVLFRRIIPTLTVSKVDRDRIISCQSKDARDMRNWHRISLLTGKICAWILLLS